MVSHYFSMPEATRKMIAVACLPPSCGDYVSVALRTVDNLLQHTAVSLPFMLLPGSARMPIVPDFLVLPESR